MLERARLVPAWCPGTRGKIREAAPNYSVMRVTDHFLPPCYALCSSNWRCEMRIYCGPSKGVKQKARLIRLQAIRDRVQRWRPWFAWRPVRLGEDDCRWMETIERRYRLAVVYEYHDGRSVIMWNKPDYRAVAWPEDGM